MSIFEAIYWFAIVIEMAVRAPIRKKQRKETKSESRVTTQEKVLLGHKLA
jgi:hypothetical protein